MSDAEHYLRRFHREREGATAAGLGLGRTREGMDGYELVLAALGSARPVLDIGCGDGVLLTRLGHGAIGVDLSPDDVGRAVSRGASAVVARGQTLPFGDASFAAVVSHLALMLMPLEATLAEIRRVLEPGGALVAILQSDTPPSGSFMTFAQRMHDALEGVSVPELGDVRSTDREAMDAMLGEAGFREVRFRDFTLHFEPLHRRALFETLYGVDLVPPAKRAHVLAAAELPGECAVRVRRLEARAA